MGVGSEGHVEVADGSVLPSYFRRYIRTQSVNDKTCAARVPLSERGNVEDRPVYDYPGTPVQELP